MEASILMAKEFMKNSGLTDLKLAKKAAKALVGFAEAGAEIGVAGEMYKPNLETVRAILAGLNKLAAEATGKPARIYQPGDKHGQELWADIPGKIQYQCSRCRHVKASGERFKTIVEKKNENVSITTRLCPRCGCSGFYLFKERTR